MFLAAQMLQLEKFHRNGQAGHLEKAKHYILFKLKYVKEV
jgi:hypothetical protein